LLWPFALVRLGRRRGLWLAAAACLAVPFVRLAWYPGVPFGAAGLGIGFTFDTVFDGLATGCLLAGLRDVLWARSWYRRLLGSPLFVLIPLAACAVASVHERPRFMYLVGYTAMNVAIGVTIDQTIRYPHTWAGKALNSAGMVWIGTLSYSLYLWQQLFLNPSGALATLPLPILLAMILTAACASYYGVERPLLAWRERRGRLAAPARPAIAA
jgi:peptidoglycan/LPS O-acetylase OafA/YrhL